MNTITVPVSSHVRKFLIHRYGSDTIELTRKNKLGNFIAAFLQSEDFQIHKLPKKLDHTITFVLNSRLKKNKSFMTEDNAKKLSYHFDQEFKSDFCHHIDFFVTFGYSKEEAMESFCKKYDVEEQEYSRDNMRRYYDRYWNKPEKKTLAPKNNFPDNVLPIGTIPGSKYDKIKSKVALTFSIQRVQPHLAVAV